MFDHLNGFAEGRATAPRCERCGAPNAGVVELGYLLCAGFHPFAGVYRWNCSKACLCEKHALWAFLRCCAATALFGFWGLPGMGFAPIRMWRNVSSLRHAFPSTALFAVTVYFGVLLTPIVLVASCVLWIIQIRNDF